MFCTSHGNFGHLGWMGSPSRQNERMCIRDFGAGQFDSWYGCMSRKELDIICFHEAGHAVMAFACGAIVESVVVTPESYVGYRYSSDFTCQILALISLSGMAADHIHWESLNHDDKKDDEFITGDKSDQENTRAYMAPP